MAAMGKTLENEQPTRRGAFISWWWLAIAAFLIIAVPTGILIAKKLRGSDVDRGTEALIDAFSKQRLIEPRLSGGFKGGEFRPSNDGTSEIKTGELERARGLIMDAVARGDPRADLTYARLLLSQGERLREALKYLRRAVASAPESPEAHNDLGVCLILQGKLEDAIDEFDVALEHKADMPEALLNRASCYQRLLLRDPAHADLSRVSEIERDKSWLAEITRRVEEVSRPLARRDAAADTVAGFDAAFSNGQIDEAKRIADQNSELLRKHSVWELTIQHLQSAVDGDRVKAELALSEMELIGIVLTETRSDSTITDIAKHLRDLPESERLLELELTRNYVGLMDPFRTDDEARIKFERLGQQFRDRANYAFQVFCAFEVAECYYTAKRFRDSIEKLQETLSLIGQRQWPRDRARVLNLLAYDHSVLDQDSLAIKYSEQAISLCHKSPELEAKILQYVSSPYLRLGNSDAALAHLRDSTTLYLDNEHWPRRAESLAHNYSQIANIYSLRGQHRLALLYGEQALKYSEQANEINYAAEYSSFIAVEHARLSQFDQAETQLSRAFDHLAKLAPGHPRNDTESRILINAGEVATRRNDVSRALQYYEKAEALIDLGEGNLLPKINILRDRARAYAASGQTESAHSNLVSAITLIEKNRANIETGDQRIQFLAASHSTFDQLISLDVALGLTAEAFDMSESSRARALLDEVSSDAEPRKRLSSNPRSSTNDPSHAGHVNPLKHDEIQPQLPEDLTLLEYVVTDHRTYLLLVTRSRIKILESSATTEILDRLVHDYVSDLQQMAPLDEVNDKAVLLYDYLIRPVEEEISGNANLCIVPDEALHFLPFAALVNQSGEYLIKSHRLTYAPSASVLVRCIKEYRAKPGTSFEKILAVGNPEINRDSFPNLPSLPFAETEADESRRFYGPGSVVLTREKATEPSVLAAMISCDVAHLALHCMIEEGSPGLAALMLAGADSGKTGVRNGLKPASEPGSRTLTSGAVKRSALSGALPEEPVEDPNDGLLFLRELQHIKLPHTKLVVLSACQSGLGQYYRGEGIVSLIRPFLASGVPTVAASLWPVNEQATSDLMIEFHRQRRLANKSAGSALQAAEIKLSESATFKHPYYWAPFILVGADN
jgi:CHAT domain-containing protein/Tfp pilus assembly protein PilF